MVVIEIGEERARGKREREKPRFHYGHGNRRRWREGDRRRRSDGGGASASADLYEHDPAIRPARPDNRAWHRQINRKNEMYRIKHNKIKLNSPVLKSLRAWFYT